MKHMLTKALLMGTMAAMTCGLIAAEPTPPGAPAPMPQGQPGQLTIEQIGKMLDDMGFNPKPYSDKDGKVLGYDVSFKSGTWTIGFSVSLSPSQAFIWFNAGLVKVDNAAGVDATALMGLLAMERNIWPAYLYYSSEYQLLRLAMPLANNGVKPATLREELNNFAEIIKVVFTACEKATKPAPATPPGPAKLPN